LLRSISCAERNVKEDKSIYSSPKTVETLT